MSAFRLRTALVALVLALGLTACGDVNPQDPHVADADNNGDYVQAGPVTYQLQISRELNQYSTEDSEYVKGIAPGTTPRDVKKQLNLEESYVLTRGRGSEPILDTENLFETVNDGAKLFATTGAEWGI